jgi:hypothetical protein
MAGFSGAVEDGVRNTGIVIALVVSLALGWAYGSLLVGAGAFVAGSLIAVLWGHHAAQVHLERRMRDEETPPPEGQ